MITEILLNTALGAAIVLGVVFIVWLLSKLFDTETDDIVASILTVVVALGLFGVVGWSVRAVWTFFLPS